MKYSKYNDENGAEDAQPRYERSLEIYINIDGQRKICPFKLERELKERYVKREDIIVNRRGKVLKSECRKQNKNILKAKNISLRV